MTIPPDDQKDEPMWFGPAALVFWVAVFVFVVLYSIFGDTLFPWWMN